ncbi:preprotein translocase subunit YajC [Haloferula sp. A504]|uniref:preprotein translocase subunit YajC n=1 Tax=Haloferula sp. A504 TaxID=3373601 RepID=UPI0031C921CA|nr:preprotein translocase subunit YajC [Verrucomicrobiaceae bacterium E54]
MNTHIFHNLFILAQGGTGSGGGGGLLGNPLVMMGLMVVMFYFLLIRPQQRQRKELQKRIDALQTGDRVVTTAGIHAIVHNIKDKTVVLKLAEGTMVEFDKPAIATVTKKKSAEAGASSDSK